MTAPADAQSISSMSDADFLSVDPANYASFTYSDASDETTPSDVPEVPEAADDTPAHESDSEDATEYDDGDSGDDSEDSGSLGEDRAEDEYDDDGSDTDPDGDDSDDDNRDMEDDSSSDSDSDSEGSDGELTPEQLLAEIMSPLKASGGEFQIRTSGEVRSLMQKGIDYQKKMQGIAPHMRTVRTLTQAGITPEELNYMIDLRNKVPAAINKLMQDSGIDPHDLDSDDGKSYVATDHQVSETSMAVTDVLESLKDTPTYPRFIKEIGQSWDESSRTLIGQRPHIMGWINEQMASGIYDLVISEVNRSKTLGKLDGLNDLQAYQQVGEAMNAQGAFDHLTQPAATGSQGQRKLPANKKLPPKQVSDDPKRNAARKAAGSVTQKPSTKGNKLSDFDIAQLSDAEFMAQLGSKLR